MDVTEIKTARVTNGTWAGFSGGKIEGETLTYWMRIPTLPEHPPFTQLDSRLYPTD